MKKIITVIAILFVCFSSHAQVLYLFGGSNNEVFLGILNASSFETKSIWNEYGSFGSCYQSKSIWNKHGRYGSKYSQYSPFNEYALNPPVVVDKEGNFYGYFTVGSNMPFSANFALMIYKFHEIIPDDLDYWYKQIMDE